MKRCAKCGAIQNDSRHHCIDCGEKLGKPLSEAEVLEIEERLDNTLDDMSDRTEDFYVPLRDKIMGVISVLGADGDTCQFDLFPSKARVFYSNLKGKMLKETSEFLEKEIANLSQV